MGSFPKITAHDLAVLLISLIIFSYPSLEAASITFTNYAVQSVRTFCGTPSYTAEPIFELFLAGASYIINIFRKINCSSETAELLLAAPYAISLSFMILFAYASRKLGLYALCFATFMALEGSLSKLPFHLVRQFAALMIFLIPLYYVLRGAIREEVLLIAAFLASFIHFAAWLLFGIVVVSFIIDKVHIKRRVTFGETLGSVSKIFFILTVALMPAFLIWYFGILDYVQAKVRGSMGMPFSGLWQLIGGGTGAVFFAKTFFLLSATLVLSIYSRSRFLALIFFGIAVAWYLLPAVGANSVVLNRVFVFFYSIAYLGIVVFLRDGRLPNWVYLANALFLLVVVLSFFYDETTSYLAEPEGSLMLDIWLTSGLPF